MMLSLNMCHTSIIRMVHITKTEKCPCWLHDSSVVVKTEFSKLLDYTDPKVLLVKLVL